MFSPLCWKHAGGDVSQYCLDGESMLDMIRGGEEKTHDSIFWEMDGQTAIRKGRYKLVINVRLVEGEEQRAPMFLSDLETDQGERVNLA